MVKPYTKYAVQINDKDSIRYELEKASTIAKSGRPGAVWIDIPLDIQASDVQVDQLKGYDEQFESCLNRLNYLI